MAADLGQQTVEFSSLVRRAAEESYLSLKELVETCKTPQERSDSEKKIDLLKFIVKTRQRMLRLHVLSKWCLQVPLIQYCQQLAATLSSHDTCFTQTADSLFYMHEGLQQARAPIFDVPSAVEVLLTGGYSRIPKCIEDLGFQSALDEDLQKPALKKLEMVLRSKLLDVPIPKEISEVTVTDGAATLIVNGEFKIILTLGYRGHLSLWRILHLELLVGEKYQPIKLEETRRYALGDDLERRMAAAENPFLIMYTILHELCVSLVMDTVLRQVKILRQGRWKDAIRFELISDSLTGQGVSSSSAQVVQDTEYDSTTQKIPGLKIIYWLDWARNPTASDSGSSPFIKIEPGQDLQIKCLHSTFVFDPVTDKEAELTLQLSCIDVEKLLLRAIICNRHTRLLDIQRELRKNVHICQAPTDVILKREGDKTDSFSWKKEGGPSIHGFYGDEVLQVRVYGSSYIRLRINIRNGRFLFQCSKNILATSALLECEEALNLGSMTATDLFISLRSKSILHLFASIGRSLGLKVYENCLGTLKIPKSVLLGSDLLLLGFPQCGNSYFLLMQLDKDFRPFFNLLETLPESGGKLPSASDSIHVIRLNKIDISRMQIGDDDLNLSLLNWEKMRTLPNIANLNQLSENVLPESALEHNLQLPDCSQTSFSSIVDEVFESEKDSSGNQVSGQSFPSSFSVPAFSHLSSLSTNNQGIVAGVSSPKLDGGIQNSQMSTFNEVSASLNSTFYLSGNAKGQLNSGVFSSSSMRNPSFQKLTSSKSEQDLSTLKPPYSSEPGQFSALDDGQSKFISGSSGSSLVVKGQLMSPPRTTVSQDMIPISRINGSKGLSYSQLVGSVRNIGSSSLIISPSSRNLEFVTPHSLEVKDIAKQEKTTRKRSLSEILTMMPSFKELDWDGRPCKRIKTLESAISPALSAYASSKLGEHIYASLVAEAVHGNVPSNVYTSVLLHVVRHCSLCIKHARLTTQMESLEIPYVEEIGLRSSSSNLWFRLPFSQDGSWQHICLRLGKPGSMSWDVKIKDPHFQELWELYKGNNTTPWYPGVRIANASDVDSHIHYDSEGVILCYKTVEVDSIERLVSDLRRLSNARLFSRGMRRLISVRSDDKVDDSNLSSENKLQHHKSVSDPFDKLTEQMRRTFKIEAVGLMSLWFSYGSMPVMAHFVVEWEAGKEGCTMHVSPDHLWPHTKFLEDFINGGDVASFLDCIRLTAGPLLALAAAIPPARMSGPVSAGPSPASKQGGYVPSQGFLPNNSSISNVVLPVSSAPSAGTSVAAPLTTHSMHNATASLSAAGRCVSGIVPSSLLPIDVSVVLRGPYWIRVIYRKKFAVDMRCFAGDQVWLQPATPPKGGPSIGGSLPCPQFRPFIMEHVAQGLNALEPNFSAAGHLSSSNNAQSSTAQSMAASGIRPGSVTTGVGMQRPVALIGNQMPGNLNRIGNNMLPTSGLSSGISGVPMRIAQGTGVPVHVRGELNTAFIGLGDDGGYGGGWVPLAALKKVLRGILKYLGVLWLFAQLPDLLKEILGSILKDSEGALLNLDQEQPALRFFVGGYVFAVSVHRVQLLLQVLSVKRFHHQQQQLTQASSQEELSPSEINEICDYFSRRVASEPYDASRVASFITLLTVPVLVLREFLKLIAWKKGLLSQPHGADMASAQRARIELCLENHSGTSSHQNENSESLSVSKSNIHHDRAHSSVDFALTFVLDPTHIPHINAAGGAAWLPYCVSVRLKYSYAENSSHISFLRTDGSHGGRACWSRADDWEKCKQRLARAVDYANGNSVGDISQGRLRLVAEALQRTLQASLQQLRDGSLSSASTLT